MHPVLIFATGLVTGIIGVKMIKQAKASGTVQDLGDRTRRGVEQAQSGLRHATVEGLAAVERASASLRSKLEPEAEPTVAATPELPTKPAEPASPPAGTAP